MSHRPQLPQDTLRAKNSKDSEALATSALSAAGDDTGWRSLLELNGGLQVQTAMHGPGIVTVGSHSH